MVLAVIPLPDVLKRLQTHERFTLDGIFDHSSLEVENLQGTAAEWMLDVDGIQASVLLREYTRTLPSLD